MRTKYHDRTGILIVRLWNEGPTAGGFRARITKTLDSVSIEKEMTMAGNPDGVYAVVRDWVEEFTNPN